MAVKYPSETREDEVNSLNSGLVKARRSTSDQVTKVLKTNYFRIPSVIFPSYTLDLRFRLRGRLQGWLFSSASSTAAQPHSYMVACWPALDLLLSPSAWQKWHRLTQLLGLNIAGLLSLPLLGPDSRGYSRGGSLYSPG